MLALPIASYGSVIFPSSWEDNVTIEDTGKKLEAFENKYLTLLNSQKPDLGLYLVTAYEKDFESGENKYNYGIEWRLFDEGWWQSKREKMKKILETKLEFLQLKRSNFLKKIVLMRQHIHFAHNRLLFEKALSRSKLLEKVLQRRRKALKSGFATRVDVKHLETELEIANQEIEYLKTVPKEGFTSYELSILNKIEYAPLKPLNSLVSLAIENKPDLKIQDVMTKRADFFPSWTDDLDVTLYVKRRNEFYESQRWCYGVKVAIPLYYNGKRSRIIELQKLLYVDQKNLIKRQLNEELAIRVGRFKKAQFEVKRSQSLYSLAKLELEDAIKKSRLPIQNLKTEPLRSVESLRLKEIDARYNVLENRLRAYLYLLDLLEVCGVSDPQSVIQ